MKIKVMRWINSHKVICESEKYFHILEVKYLEYKTNIEHTHKIEGNSLQTGWEFYEILEKVKYSKNIPINPNLPLFQHIGMEWEFNKNDVSYREVIGDYEPKGDLNPPFAFFSSENDTIWEAITEPIPITNLSLLLGVGFKMAQAGAIEAQEGAYDIFAGSMHTHLDIPEIGIWHYNFLYKKLKFIKDLKHRNTIFFKRASEVQFRDALYEGNVERYFYKNYNSKWSRITFNSKRNKIDTLEMRINESPYPLWAFLLPSVLFTKKRYFNLKWSLDYWKQFLDEDNFKLLEIVLPIYFDMQGDGEQFTEWLSNNQELMDLDW